MGADPGQEAFNVFKEVKKVTDAFMKESKCTGKYRIPISIQGLTSPDVIAFGKALNAVIEAWETPGLGTFGSKAEIERAFYAGKVLFFDEVDRLYSLQRDDLAKAYKKMTHNKVPSKEPLGISELCLVQACGFADQYVKELRDNIFYESTLMEILPSMLTLDALYQVHDATKEQMVQDLHAMQAAAAFSFNYVGKTLGAQIGANMPAWNRSNRITKRFWSPDADENKKIFIDLSIKYDTSFWTPAFKEALR
jgi:hypothetical protein